MEKSLFTCQYCGKDTSEVEYDYLVGVDHLSCALEQEQNQKNPIEKCVICGVDTQYRFRTPIDFRYNYVEGAGQLCTKCGSKDEEPIALDSHRKLFTLSEYMVLSKYNDKELGAIVRKLFCESIK
jgi:hypothetical protein